MAVPVVERKTDASLSPYTEEEAAIVAQMKKLINYDIYLFADVRIIEDPHDQKAIPEQELERRKKILDEVQLLVDNILLDRHNEKKQFKPEDFDAYVEEHEIIREYAFMCSPPPAVNMGGWGYFTGLLRPLEIGSKFGHSAAFSKTSNWKSGH